MKRFAILAVLFASAICSVVAQPKDRIRITNEKFGFETMEFDMPNGTAQFKIEPLGKYYLVENVILDANGQATEKVKATVYRMSDRAQVWQDEYSSGGVKSCDITKAGILQGSFLKLNMLDFETGAKKWHRTAYRCVGIVGDNMIASPMGSLMKLSGYSLWTGELQWRMDSYTSYGLSYTQAIDSIHDYIVGKDLYRINWQTGEVKTIEAKAAIKHSESKAPSFAIVEIVHINDGDEGKHYVGQLYNPTSLPDNIRRMKRDMIFLPDQDRIGSLCSGIMPHDGKNYFADRNSLKCFDDDMNVLWNVELPKKAGRSDVLIKGDTVYVVNLALGLYGSTGYMRRVGNPWVASFNAKDGTLLMYKEIEDAHHNFVQSTIMTSDKLYMLFYDKSISLSFADNKLETTSFPTDDKGEMLYYVSNNIFYRKTSDGYFQAIKATGLSVPVVAGKGDIIDARKSVPSVICAANDRYRLADNYKDMYLLHNEKELWCLKGDKATLISDNVISFKLDRNLLTIMSKTENKAIVFNLDKMK